MLYALQGMRHLHESVLSSHGRLKSKNCVVDGRFLLKITDFGVNQVIRNIGVTEAEPASDLLWTAPELLRERLDGDVGTQRGDVYSFAIIMQELVLRTRPFAMLEISAQGVKVHIQLHISRITLHTNRFRNHKKDRISSAAVASVSQSERGAAAVHSADEAVLERNSRLETVLRRHCAAAEGADQRKVGFSHRNTNVV